MPAKILGQAAPSAVTNTTVYTVPATKSAVFNVSMTNTASTPAMVRLALAAAAAPTSSEYVEYDTLLPQNGVLERGGLVAEAGKLVVVYSSIAGVSVSVYGYEE